MDKCYHNRQQIIKTYDYLINVLPINYMKINIKKSTGQKYNNINNLPRYIFDQIQYKNVNKHNSKNIIMTVGSDNVASKRNFNNNLKHSLHIKLPNILNNKNLCESSINTYSNRNTEADNCKSFFDLNSIRQNNLLGNNKNFKGNPVLLFQTKKNIFLPSLTERYKNKKCKNNYIHTSNDCYLNKLLDMS